MKNISLIVIITSLILNNFAPASSANDNTSSNIDISPSYSGDISSSADPISFWQDSLSSVFKHIEDSSEVTTEEITVKEDTPKETLTPTPEIKTETGGYTAGGYASTKPITKYKDNGIKYWNTDYAGTIFRENETQDLHNWVEAGYTRWRTVDNRIASRKGGVDNPRIAEFLCVGNADTRAALVPDYAYNLVTVMKGDYNVSKNSKEFKELKEMSELAPGSSSVYSGKKSEAGQKFRDYLTSNGSNLEKWFNYNAEEHGETYSSEFNTMLNYNCRNYCGDFIYMTIAGYKTVKSLNDGETAKAGTDYILSCPSDPSAFKLVEGKELKQYYEVSAVRESRFP